MKRIFVSSVIESGSRYKLQAILYEGSVEPSHIKLSGKEWNQSWYCSREKLNDGKTEVFWGKN